jgi:hypothetical protein
MELLVEKLKHAFVGFIPLVEKIDDNHIVLLAVSMAAPNALLDSLRVPWQVIVDHKRAELKIDTFRGRFGGDKDLCMVPEVLNQS